MSLQKKKIRLMNKLNNGFSRCEVNYFRLKKKKCYGSKENHNCKNTLRLNTTGRLAVYFLWAHLLPLRNCLWWREILVILALTRCIILQYISPTTCPRDILKVNACIQRCISVTGNFFYPVFSTLVYLIGGICWSRKIVDRCINNLVL